MKKSISLCLISIFMVVSLLFSSCGSKTAAKETTTPHDSDTTFHVAVIQYSDSYSFSEIRQAFISRMRLLGYDEAKMKFDIKNAQGSQDTLNEIASSLVGSNYNLIVPVSTVAAKAVADSGCKIPSVFIGAYNPVGEGLSSSIATPDKNMSGTSYKTDVSNLLTMIGILTPNVKNVAVLYTKDVPAVSDDVSAAKKYLTDKGYTVDEVVLNPDSNLTETVKNIVAKDDAIYIPDDDTLDGRMSEITAVTNESGKFVYASSLSAVNAGALAAICPSPTDLAKNAAAIADKILRGSSVSSVSIMDTPSTIKYVSKSTATKFNVDIPTLDNMTVV